ncbi:hypothetical protein R7Q40_11295 [Vibrio sp. 506]|uniref:hypothetical protein n=1 Tax=Vibrio TaxID=662 RepID=UPI0009407171|nr:MULTISPECIES: hypothetical protein [Vibrio]MCS0029002.1 hypothetical protein [Vibrio alginolyticus]MDW2054904.1 hypothetical protein [Vibrio sp. 506]OKQ14247.1 hypothetical protein H058_08245 [Vibrio antiquarius]
MTWKTASFCWSGSTQNIQSSAEAVLTKVEGHSNKTVERIQALKGQVIFARHPLSTNAEALLNLRTELDALLTSGQVLCVHPYQHAIGTVTNSGNHLTPDEAVTVLANKLKDFNDRHHPKGNLHVVGWMLAENTLANFASATKALYEVVNISELGMVSRRVSKEQSLQPEKMTKPATIVQPRLKPVAQLNQEPLRSVEQWQGAQIAQLESLASDRQTPVDKLAALAEKRAAQLNDWSQAINSLKQDNVELHKFAASGTAEMIATKLNQSTPPGRENSYTFACLFISAKPITFVSELFA